MSSWWLSQSVHTVGGIVQLFMHCIKEEAKLEKSLPLSHPATVTNIPRKVDTIIRKLKAHVNREKKQRMSRLQAQLAEKSRVEVDESLHKDLDHIMKEMTGYVREDLTQELLNIPGVKSFLSETLSGSPGRFCWEAENEGWL